MPHAIPPDLQPSLTFVTERIEKQAAQSGTPLTEEEHQLLSNLPTRATKLDWYDPEYPTFEIQAPIDHAYERLCLLAKEAYAGDLRADPGLAANWRLAAAVSTLHQHPMAWLLWWAGLRQHKPWWDRLLLFLTALLWVLFNLVVAIVGGDRISGPRGWLLFVVANVGALVLIYFICRWTGSRHLRQLFQK